MSTLILALALTLGREHPTTPYHPCCLCEREGREHCFTEV